MSFLKKLWRILGISLYKTAGRIVVPLVVKNSNRTRVLIMHGTDVLLCQTFISSGKWNVIGGGQKRGETLIECAQREVLEEVGIAIDPRTLVDLGEMKHKSNGSQFTMHCFAVLVNSKEIKMRWPELVSLQWFPSKSLPITLNNDAEELIKRYKVYSAKN